MLYRDIYDGEIYTISQLQTLYRFLRDHEIIDYDSFSAWKNSGWLEPIQ